LKEKNIFYIIVTDAMHRESAIADDYWSYTLKHSKQDQIEVVLQNIERK
jgi:pyrimidine operon attenuation protein/uracil phosphoribosyltransferase